MKLDSGQVACRRSCRQEKGCWVTKQSFMQLLWHLKIACRRFCRQAGATISHVTAPCADQESGIGQACLMTLPCEFRMR